MEFKLEKDNRNLTDEDIIRDKKSIAKKLEGKPLKQKDYVDNGGRVNPATIYRRLGRWNDVLLKAGLTPFREVNISISDLFDNIKELWIVLGSQPRRREIDSTISKYSSRPYVNRFGSWRGALKAFIQYVNKETPDSVLNDSPVKRPSIPKTPRYPSLTLRFQVMKRDNFKCVRCGRSPASDTNLELHIDHDKPWSKGGITELKNLQTLCRECNRGKSNT